VADKLVLARSAGIAKFPIAIILHHSPSPAIDCKNPCTAVVYYIVITCDNSPFIA
jgi:hypothetical protein